MALFSVLQITIQRDSGLDVSSPKHGKVDPQNMPHVGGNTWAGGTGFHSLFFMHHGRMSKREAVLVRNGCIRAYSLLRDSLLNAEKKIFSYYLMPICNLFILYLYYPRWKRHCWVRWQGWPISIGCWP